MKFVFTSYAGSPDYDHPGKWLERIEAYTGLLEQLATTHTVISIERIAFEGELERKGVVYRFMNIKGKKIYFPRRMHRYIRKQEPDAVFVNGLIFPLQLVQLRLALGRSVKIFVLHRAERPFKGIKRWWQLFADKFVDAYLFTSIFFGDEWKNNIDTRKIREIVQASSIFQPVDKNNARESLQIQGSPVFLWVGNMIARKDPLTVLKAFIDYIPGHPHACLYMIWRSGELLDQVKEMTKHIPAIKLVGFKEHDVLQDWYSAADFFLAGSHHEGSGVAVMEAMSCGCIPILTSIPSFKKMAGPGGESFMYEPGNDRQLLSILKSVKDVDLESERSRVVNYFRDELSFEAIARKIGELADTGKKEK